MILLFFLPCWWRNRQMPTDKSLNLGIYLATERVEALPRVESTHAWLYTPYRKWFPFGNIWFFDVIASGAGVNDDILGQWPRLTAEHCPQYWKYVSALSVSRLRTSTMHHRGSPTWSQRVRPYRLRDCLAVTECPDGGGGRTSWRH